MTKSIPLKPPPIELTSGEWKRVETSYQRGLHKEIDLKSVAKHVPIAVRDIRRFLNLWSQLSPMAQGCIVGDDDLADIYEGKTHEYRIVTNAHEALITLISPRGRPATLANIHAAEVLTEIWKSRGGHIKPGRLYAEKKAKRDERVGSASEYSPNAYINFIGNALRHLDPSMKTDRLAARRAKSAVEALQKMGRL